MKNQNILLLVLLNLGLACVNVIIFSPGLVGMEILGGSKSESIMGLSCIVMSFVIFMVGNYKLLQVPKEVVKPQVLANKEDYLEVILNNKHKKLFKDDLQIVKEQVERFEKKKINIEQVLNDKFDSSGITFGKFNTVIKDIKAVFFLNLKSIMNKVNVFDQEEYEYVLEAQKKGTLSQVFIQSKLNIYNEYSKFVRESLEDNELILLKMDELLLELSKLNTLGEGELEDMIAMQELDELIKKAKLYK